MTDDTVYCWFLLKLKNHCYQRYRQPCLSGSIELDVYAWNSLLEQLDLQWLSPSLSQQLGYESTLWLNSWSPVQQRNLIDPETYYKSQVIRLG